MALDATTIQHIKNKAASGQAMNTVTAEKQKIYNDHQAFINSEIQRKALTGQPLDSYNDYKTNLYNQYQQEPINKLYDTMQQRVNNMYNKQQEAQLAQLKATKEKAIGQINQQKAQVAPQFQQARNQTDTVNLQNVQRLREIMQANGLGASGENVTAQVAQNNQRQGDLNALNLQEQQQLNQYDQRIADINNPSEEQALLAQLEAQRASTLWDAYNSAQNLGYQRQNDAYEKYWRQYTYNNMSAAEKKQFEQNAAQFGEEMAWRDYSLKYQGEIDKSLAQTQLEAYQSGFNSSSEGGGNTAQPTSTGPATFQSHMNEAVKMGVDASWVPLLTEIVKRESSFNPTAKNPKSTAYGYGQFLQSTRQNYEKKTGLNYNNPVHQLVMMAQYVKDRYGTPSNALAFWNKNHWY